MEIKELKKGTKNAEVTGEITEVGPIREFNRFGTPGKVANATLKDDSGEIQLTLWNEQIDLMKEGTKLKVTNGFVKEWNGSLQLSSGKFGNIEILEDWNSN